MLLIIILSILTYYLIVFSLLFIFYKRTSGREVSEISSEKSDWTRDELLCEQHDAYIREVTRSGMPIWMYDQSIPSINPNN